jgi:hypothetical protein
LVWFDYIFAIFIIISVIIIVIKLKIKSIEDYSKEKRVKGEVKKENVWKKKVKVEKMITTSSYCLL